MSPAQHCPRLRNLLGATGKYLRQRALVHRFGEADQVQRQKGLAPHRPHVAERVRGGNPPKDAGVIHHGRKEIRRKNKRALSVKRVDRGVVSRVKPDQQPAVPAGRQPRQQAGKPVALYLCPAPAAHAV